MSSKLIPNDKRQIRDGSDSSIVADVETHEGKNSLRVVSGHRETFFVHLDTADLSATSPCMVIDLSDTTNWPHTNTDHIVLEWFQITMNPATSFRGDVELGFLSNVDDTNGDFHKVHSWHFASQAVETDVSVMHDGHGLDLEVAEWFGPTDADNVLWQTDVNLIGPDGATSYPSGDGDLVMLVTRTAGSITTGLSVGYTTR